MKKISILVITVVVTLGVFCGLTWADPLLGDPLDPKAPCRILSAPPDCYWDHVQLDFEACIEETRRHPLRQFKDYTCYLFCPCDECDFDKDGDVNMADIYKAIADEVDPAIIAYCLGRIFNMTQYFSESQCLVLRDNDIHHDYCYQYSSYTANCNDYGNYGNYGSYGNDGSDTICNESDNGGSYGNYGNY